MEITIHGKQMDVGDTLRAHAQDKLEDLTKKYFNHTVFATITFSREGHGHKKTKVHISIQLGKNILIVSSATEADPYVAFDSASEKAAKQLRRYKRKIRDHHERMEQTPESELLKARDYILAATPEEAEEPEDGGATAGDEPVIIAEMSKSIETMSVSEAVMRMDLEGQKTFVFRNLNHSGLNVVYIRDDGNVGWIDPENVLKSA